MGGDELDELLASLAARCRVCYYVRILTFFLFNHGDRYDNDTRSVHFILL